MDAVALLKQDHRTVEELFRRYESMDDGEERTEIVRQFTRELSVHAAIEEQVLYPEVKDVLPQGRSMAEEAIQEHQEAKEALADLERMDATDPGFDRKVRTLIADVRHHVEEEENEMLPRLASAVPASTLDELGEKMERAKGTAPTRPHPHAPSSPPGNLVAGTVAAVVDRVRDVVSSRSETPKRRRPKKRTSAPRTRKASTATPKKKATTRKTTGRKATGRKATTRKATGRKATARKATGSKATARTATRKAKTTSRPVTRPRGSTTGPEIHVLADPRGGWRAEKKGSTRALARSDNKSEVVKRARESARAQEGTLIVHKASGGVQERRRYSTGPSRGRGPGRRS
ncbi:MAG TPA: hemerythrin domain-containing protein [Actinomycetota bacterium]|nr:hemerythrin domain-containing protein [Actinomycetota bacterium]